MTLFRPEVYLRKLFSPPAKTAGGLEPYLL
ncbi:MAG: hypothetical protein JWO75_3096 [Actinomycetia bacterium]|jgi:hypothetical protein|nr:hypothetical protein [Actinomycetes bacterium]